MARNKCVITKLAITICALFFTLSMTIDLPASDEGGFKSPPHLSWASKMREGNAKVKKIFEFSAPIFSDGRLFIGGQRGAMCAVEVSSGKKIWCFNAEGSVSTVPLLVGENLYFGDEKGYLYSLQVNDGKELWRSQMPDEVMATPVLVGDTLYVVTMNMRFVAVDPTSGAVKWHLIKRGSMMKFAVRGASNPVSAYGNIYVGYPDGSLVAHSPVDGHFIWMDQLSNRTMFYQDVDTTPLIIGDRLYIATTDGSTYCLNPKDGKTIWKADFGSPNDLVLDGDKLLVSGGGVLRALNPANGTLIWERKFEDAEISAPAVKDGIVVVCSTVDKIYLVDESNGEVIYSRHLSKGTYGKPVFSGDTLYVLSNAGTLFALQGK